jgi:hypothetical protein
MHHLVRFLLPPALALALTLATSGCATAASSGTPEPAIHPGWSRQMEAGLDAWQLGHPDAAALHYRRAVQLARKERLPCEELAFSTYHLGEAIRLRPETSRGESALALFEESRGHFEDCFGADHPVLIPVLVRIAALQAETGNPAQAEIARTRADRIAVRFFPASHFLRERFGVSRPAAMLHPLEVLDLMGAYTDTPEQVVQGP